MTGKEKYLFCGLEDFVLGANPTSAPSQQKFLMMMGCLLCQLIFNLTFFIYFFGENSSLLHHPVDRCLEISFVSLLLFSLLCFLKNIFSPCHSLGLVLSYSLNDHRCPTTVST